MLRVALIDLKVIRQSRMMAAKTHMRMGNWASETASLVAAMTPTLPVARRNLMSSVPCLSLNALTAATTRSMVSALWSTV